MGRRTDSRSRMIEAASELFRQRGYHATAFSDVLEASGAPRGSIYFHFPGGKHQLAREAIARAGEEIEAMMEQAASQAECPGSLVRAFGEILAQRLEASGYQSGCALATMVLELAPEDEELSAEFDTGFSRWRAALIGCFEPWGITPQRALALADLVMSTFEGALVLSRAARSTEAIRRTTATLAEIVDRESATPTATPPSRNRASRARPSAADKRSLSN